LTCQQSLVIPRLISQSQDLGFKKFIIPRSRVRDATNLGLGLTKMAKIPGFGIAFTSSDMKNSNCSSALKNTKLRFLKSLT